MLATQIDQSDAQELVEILQLLTDWITTDPDRLNVSLTRFVGNPADGTSQLAEDLNASHSSSAATTTEQTLPTEPVITTKPRTSQRGDNPRRQVGPKHVNYTHAS